jgi:Fe/S biogenesis protein NfuA
MIQVTELAHKKVIEVAEAQDRIGAGLRISVSNGGTAMAEFGLQFIDPEEIQDGDEVFDAGEFKVCWDAASAPFLKDATVDFIDEITGAGFKIDAPKAFPPKPTGPLAEKVMKIIEERINPSLQSHGGMISLEGIQDNTAFLRFGGGCQGCGMANVTLKQGVEVMLKEEVPELVAVKDVTDHAGGDNPYYTPGK